MVPLVLLAMLLGPQPVLAGADTEAVELIQPHPDSLVLIEPRPAVTSVLHADGTIVEMEPFSVWSFMCSSDTSNVTIDDLRRIAEQDWELRTRGAATRTLGGGDRAGLNVVWNIGGGVPAEAEPALEAAAEYIEQFFADPVTVSINVSFTDLGPGVIGATSNNFAGWVGWSATRAGMIADMDVDDVVHDYLPSGTTIPVRYDGSSDTVSNETRVAFSVANYNAAIGSVGGSAATMWFNTSFLFDYDPSNGVPFNRMCFISVVVHEVGHVLGFVSRIDQTAPNPPFDIDALDIFRFQRTDGLNDYNPDTYEEFATTPRTVDYDMPPNDANTDIIGDGGDEWRMADGNPDQASHWQDDLNIGIMDPTQAYGETFYPDYFTEADVAAFDALGWDYPSLASPSLPTFPDGVDKNRYISFMPNTGDLSLAFQIEMTDGPGTAGVLGWAGAPDANDVSRVVAGPVFSDAWPSVVHVGDCPIAAVATYEVRSTANGTIFSVPYVVRTVARPGDRWWADIVGEKFGDIWLAPDGALNFTDIQAGIQAFEQVPGAPPLLWADVDAQIPNGVINFSDVQQIILAFEGSMYPYADPMDCP